MIGNVFSSWMIEATLSNAVWIVLKQLSGTLKAIRRRRLEARNESMVLVRVHPKKSRNVLMSHEKSSQMIKSVSPYDEHHFEDMWYMNRYRCAVNSKHSGIRNVQTVAEQKRKVATQHLPQLRASTAATASLFVYECQFARVHLEDSDSLWQLFRRTIVHWRSVSTTIEVERTGWKYPYSYFRCCPLRVC